MDMSNLSASLEDLYRLIAETIAKDTSALLVEQAPVPDILEWSNIPLVQVLCPPGQLPVTLVYETTIVAQRLCFKSSQYMF